MRSCLYRGTVMHLRTAPRRHRFCYSTCFVALDLDELPELERRLRIFGIPLLAHGRCAALRLDDREYLGDMRRGLRRNVLEWMRERGETVHEDARVVLATSLRQLGYVFNPISVFYVTDPGDTDASRAVIEVHNTFGEGHRYLAPIGAGPTEQVKQLHVSPFMPMDQRYRIRLEPPDDRFLVAIDLLDEHHAFHATWTGRRIELTPRSVAWSLLRFPLGGRLVTARIHLRALRLWLLRVPYLRKPPFVEGSGTISDTADGPSTTPRRER